ncbi:nucleotide pyrophosphohydrolase [Geoglobus acetivorans]|nr:nucleotide pyrophosphohydrolase [Geoglobus acetivorans]
MSDIIEILIDFRNRREWKKYHTPKNLALSVAIEVGELLEMFQWKKDDEILKELENEDYRRRIGEEISDVLIYLLLLAHECEIDVEKALMDKIKKNEQKYPER